MIKELETSPLLDENDKNDNYKSNGEKNLQKKDDKETNGNTKMTFSKQYFTQSLSGGSSVHYRKTIFDGILGNVKEDKEFTTSKSHQIGTAALLIQDAINYTHDCTIDDIDDEHDEKKRKEFTLL